jgi:hypothetical protein
MNSIDELKPHRYTLHWLLNDVPFTKNKNSIHLNYESSIYKVQTGLMNGEGKFSIGTDLRAGFGGPQNGALILVKLFPDFPALHARMALTLLRSQRTCDFVDAGSDSAPSHILDVFWF